LPPLPAGERDRVRGKSIRRSQIEDASIFIAFIISKQRSFKSEVYQLKKF
jgi:hypothetical protein